MCYLGAFAVIPLHIMCIFAAVLCSNHVDRCMRSVRGEAMSHFAQDLWQGCPAALLSPEVRCHVCPVVTLRSSGAQYGRRPCASDAHARPITAAAGRARREGRHAWLRARAQPLARSQRLAHLIVGLVGRLARFDAVGGRTERAGPLCSRSTVGTRSEMVMELYCTHVEAVPTLVPVTTWSTSI